MLPRFQPNVLDNNLALVRHVEEMAAKKGCTPAQIAINWVRLLSRKPGMPRIIPIPGASSPERARENAVEVELDENEMSELDAYLSKYRPVGDRYHAHGMNSLDTSTE